MVPYLSRDIFNLKVTLKIIFGAKSEIQTAKGLNKLTQKNIGTIKFKAHQYLHQILCNDLPVKKKNE